ncbi:MAG: hypothetical protein Q4D53_00200 [Leptotrichiaceae bacterium]|nr:hypothetical protein [Leptotrichiaceae bacterium]
MSTDKKRESKIIKRPADDENSLLNHPYITITGTRRKRNMGNIYEQAIEAGLKNKTIEKKVKNGKIFFEIKEPITYKNDEFKARGKFVFTKIDENYRIFIVRPQEKAVAVPFGNLNRKGKSPFDYIIENEKISKDIIFSHTHFRTEGITSYTAQNESIQLTRYYADRNNSRKVGDTILTYLKEGNQTLDEIADIWSGSGPNKYNFSGEIQAHAELLLNTKKAVQFLKLLHKTNKFVKNNFKFDKNFEKEHYRSASIADMAKDDKGNIQKKLMDFFWGEPSDKQKKEAEEIMQNLYYNR